MSHVTDRTYDLLLRGALPPEEARALARHLEEPCAVCAEVLASRPGADALDGRVDAALGRLGEARERGNDLEFARIERRLREAPPRREQRRLVPMALAAAVLAGGLAALVATSLRQDRAAWDGVKGADAAAAGPVRLRVLVVTPSPDGSALQQGVTGQRVDRGASLHFEIEAVRPAQAALVRVPAKGAPELVWSERIAGGRSAVTVEGRPAAYPLAEVDGLQRFVLVASEERLAPDRLARAIAGIAPPAPVPAGLGAREGLVLDAVDVEVR